MKDEFPFPPPAGARPVPDSLLGLPEEGALRWRAIQIWDATNALIEAIQEWADWLRRLESKRRVAWSTPMELAEVVGKAAAALCDTGVATPEQAAGMLGRFPAVPVGESKDWRKGYDLAAAKAKLVDLGDFQNELVLFQQQLEATPLSILCAALSPGADGGSDQGRAGRGRLKRSRKGVGGRRRFGGKEEERRKKILEAWEQAKAAGVLQKEFCRDYHDEHLTVKELERLVAWEAQRCRRRQSF